MKAPIAFFITAFSAGASCVSVSAGQILAVDLAKSIPLFDSLDPNEVLGFAPFPGTKRVFSSREVVFIARSHGLIFDDGVIAPSVCFERLVRRLTADEVKSALLSSIGLPDATVEIVDFSNGLFPSGQLVFQHGVVGPQDGNPRTPVLWPGRLVYDHERSLSVWAKVRVAVNREIFVAKEDISQGDVLRVGQVVSNKIVQFPSPDSRSLSLSEITGKVARREIHAGQRIVAEFLEASMDVFRGDLVRVEVVAGAARISLSAVAQSSGNQGDTIIVHNPHSGKNFRAAIEGRGKVLVMALDGVL
jgi:flagellar basal body P-ring formation protein FlgA